MSTVDKMLIKGIRSFDPENKHVITFFKPLTLIVGPNGAGKTLSCTGELPPNARSGHSFIHDPKVAGETETKGQIKLRFKTAAGKDVVCIRSFQLTQKASKMEYKAIESVLQTINPHTGEGHNNHCLELVVDTAQEKTLEDQPKELCDDSVDDLSGDEKDLSNEEEATSSQPSSEKAPSKNSTQTRLRQSCDSTSKECYQQEDDADFHRFLVFCGHGQVPEIQMLTQPTQHNQKQNFAMSQATNWNQTKKIMKVCLSYRCADMDREIPALMGVSKAILENVIFAHQDDANWPLQDPSTLKKKFDDIFSATRYTKALEVIKKLHKDQAQEIKTYKLKLENLQTLKDAAYKLRESIAQDQEKTASVKTQMQELERNIQNVDDKIHHTETTLKDLRKLQDQISTKTTERSTLFREQQKQYAALAEENEDTDEELKEWKTKFEERIALLESKISKLEREMNDTETKSYFLKQTIDECKGESNKLQTEAEAQMSLRHERDSTIQRLFARHNLGSLSNTPFSSEGASNHMVRIKSRLMDLEKDLQDKKKSNEMELKASWDCYMAANDRCKEIDAQKQAKVEIKCRALKKEYDDLNSKSLEAEKEVKVVQMKIQDVNNNLSKLQKDKDSRKRFIDSKLRSLVQQSFNIDVFPEVLDGAKEKRDVQKSKYNIADGMRQMFDPFERVARAHHVCPCCERSFSPEEEDEFVKKQRVKAASSAEHMKVLAVESSNADSHFQQLDKLRMLYEEYVKIGNETIPLTEKNLKELTEDMDQKSQALDDVIFFSGFIWLLLASHASGVVNLFRQNCYLILVFDHNQGGTLKYQPLPLLEGLLFVYPSPCERNCTVDRTVHGVCMQVVGVLAHVKSEKDLVEVLVQPIETADRLVQEMQSLQMQVDDLEYKLDFRGQGVKSVEEIQLQLNSLQSTKDSLNNDLEKLREEERYMKNDLSNIQIRWHTLREEKLEASKTLHVVKKAEEELDRLIEEKGQVDLDEKHLAEAFGPLCKEKEKLVHDYNDLKKKLQHEYEEQTEFKRIYQQEVEMLLNVTSKIKEYVL
ncbi:hypothetical protein HHK36_013104 [Tetracentron sinense]|uniref:Zinc-hook domain-containing protein n=1 Tax=Tetracentron sinense TaxID=13715 RepID=A0A835DIU1_TETSI|nr:hypothetical protein HHK36_013104 [Tetracentron sinense]